MKTALITSNTYQNHNTGDGHPEKIDRVTAVIDNFKKLDNKNLIWKKPSKFEKSLLIKTHSSEYIDHVDRSYPQNGFNFLAYKCKISLKQIFIEKKIEVVDR